jgi:hypothetical protein
MNDTQHILTPAIQQNICNYILAGGFPEVAAEAAGIPAKVFARWMRFGEAKRPIPLYRDFVQSVRQAQAQVRIVAEHKALEKSPLQWLKSGPGKETARLPGWTSPVRPPQQAKRKKGLSAEQLSGLISTLLAALGPFPEARQAAAQALIEGGWASTPDAPPGPIAPRTAPEGCAEPARMDIGPETAADRSVAGCAAETVREERGPEAVSLPEKASPKTSKPAPEAAERGEARPAGGLQPARIESATKVHPADMETKAFGLPRRPAPVPGGWSVGRPRGGTLGRVFVPLIHPAGAQFKPAA